MSWNIEAIEGTTRKRSYIYSHFSSKEGQGLVESASTSGSIGRNDQVSSKGTTHNNDHDKRCNNNITKDDYSANSSWQSIANSTSSLDSTSKLNFSLGPEWTGSSRNIEREWNPTTEESPYRQEYEASTPQTTAQLTLMDDAGPATLERNNSDSMSAYVKIANKSAAFEDIKSEAVNSWTAGVDVQLETKQEKKKAQWLSFNDFANYEPTKKRPDFNTDPTRSFFHESNSKQTYAEVADTNTPAWAVESPTTTSASYSQTDNWGWPLQQYPQQQPTNHHSTTSTVDKLTANSYVAAVKALGTADYELINLLVSVRQKRNISDTIPHFKKKLEHLLQHYLTTLADGKLSLLLNAVVDTIEDDKRYSLTDTIRKIHTHWSAFRSALLKHIAFWMGTFEDFHTVLRFLTDFKDHYPTLVDNDLSQELIKVYRCMKPVMSREASVSTRKNLVMLCGDTFDNDMDDEQAKVEEDILPDVPKAKDILMEIVEKNDPLHSYETNTHSVIANHVKQSWPAVNLRNYLSAHYLLLRQELTGPIKHAVKNLTHGRSANDILCNCAFYEGCAPKHVTLSMATSQPCVVFQLKGPIENNDAMRDDLLSKLHEGSFLMLLSEDALNSGIAHSFESNVAEPIDAILESVADECMLAQVVRHYSTVTPDGERVNLVAIHILDNGISKLRWSSMYTMIASLINARAAISTLSWLRDEHNRSDITRFSAILTPRILTAQNKLTEAQLASWSEDKHRQNLAANGRSVPDYLADAEINISCIVHKNAPQTAKPGQNVWPRYSSGLEQLAPSKRPPLYTISDSQVGAVKFALTHRVAVISGAAGTGKTYLAAKLASIISRALVKGQFHQPVLLLTKTQACLDDILGQLLQSVPDIVRFGHEPLQDSLKALQATKLSMPNAIDNNFRQFTALDRRLYRNQCNLEALLKYRNRVVALDPSVLCSTLPYEFIEALRYGYTDPDHRFFNPAAAWSQWLNVFVETSSATVDEARVTKDYNDDRLIQTQMEDLYLKFGGRYDMPLLDINTMRNRLNASHSSNYHIQDLRTAQQWPFENSTRHARDVQDALSQVWGNVHPDQLWSIPLDERQRIAQQTANKLLRFIDDEIHTILQDQTDIGRTLDDIMIQKLVYMCRFKNVIGMTADFAAANCKWVSSLWPRAVIIDEASEILETILAPSILGFRTEHVILLGTGDSISRVPLTNPTLAGEPRNYDISLFERWKASTGEIALLEEQWRMHSEVATIYDQFNSSRNNNRDSSNLLITAPVASCFANMVDGRYSMKEKLYGVNVRAYYVHYQNEASNDAIDEDYSKKFDSHITLADVDEARYVAFIAVYLSQQPFTKVNIAVIALSPLQKALIRHILHEEVPQRTCFTSQLNNIHVDVVERLAAREFQLVIISTATPGSMPYNADTISRVITRAKYGMYIIGKPDKDRVHPSWKRFAKYMEEQELYGHSMVLTCTAHGDQIVATHSSDFDRVRNGGCQRPCGSLMSEGHACKEDCHFLSHSEVICQEPCNRPRPPNCVHSCHRKCFECSKQGACPPCLEYLSLTLDCGHVVEGPCHTLQDTQHIECKEPVEVFLPCGHALTVDCCDRNTNLQCPQRRKVKLACGHTVETRCGIEPICSEMCTKNLICGHRCNEMCGVPHEHDRSRCVANCSKQLICGHYCAKGCANPDNHTERCLKRCRYVCSHGYNCIRECWRDCTRCVSACPYRCRHYSCSRKCYEKCDRPPCDNPCTKTLPCSHPCAGLCGEPCPPCVQCHGKEHECSISLRTLSEFEEGELVYMLPECGCVFSVECLDLYFENQAKNGEHTAIKLWGCPTCGQTIYRALRYNNYIKTEIALVNKIKLRMEQERQRLSNQERQQIIQAMNDETAQQINHNIVGGRWFVCENQHPYFVGDCGGATQISKCPECDAPIGGTQHKVLQSNRFYGEFDGSQKPAWPGQPGAD